ncbi:TIGR02452 family protein [Lactococcus fujiensis]|uniref:Microbial-type PARG catalytic domain-containing protein n=1 Tax=Lactococcus fujiensis JCM 16395 TaxID=1291764 RepID=A0A2A5RI44_9LACT|nr:TIGR02452 family protein [Lactococcus fujiensis]PCR98792.1 hypothetical protein RT41_GL000900 [Lactococcus fujiensis JCM 16395]
MKDNKASAEETMRAFNNEENALPTKTTYFPEKIGKKMEDNAPSFETQILVFNENCVNRVFTEVYAGHKTGIMNFASPIFPGGGFLNGASAQEEAICRGSYLYPEIIAQKAYYENNRAIDYTKHTAGLIYSENVKFIKAEIKDIEEFVEPVFADVVTVAAPQVIIGQQNEQIDTELTEKIIQTLRQFKEHNVESIVLGAFGCGVFGNNPHHVASLFDMLLQSEEFDHAFKRVIFSTFKNNIQPFLAMANTIEKLDKTFLESKRISSPVSMFNNGDDYKEMADLYGMDGFYVSFEEIEYLYPELEIETIYNLLEYMYQNTDVILSKCYEEMIAEQ